MQIAKLKLARERNYGASVEKKYHIYPVGVSNGVHQSVQAQGKIAFAGHSVIEQAVKLSFG